MPPPPWPWTDDTAMALGILGLLERHGRIEQDELPRRFASDWRAGGAHRLLEQVSGGMDWRAAAGGLFGRGSFGNGSAMRVAPLGILGGSGGPRSRGRQDAETPGWPGSPLMLGGRMQRWPGGLGLAGGS